MPDLVTLIRDAQAKRDGLVATIDAAQAELAELDREFAEVRQVLGLPAPASDGIEKTCPLCGKAFIQRSNRQKMCPSCREAQGRHVSVEQTRVVGGAMCVCENPTCPRKGQPFARRPMTSGRWCSRPCYTSTKRKGGAVPSAEVAAGRSDEQTSPADLAAGNFDPRPAADALPERRCARCYAKFTPTTTRAFICVGCAEKEKAPAPPAPADDNMVQGRDLTIVRNLTNGPRTEQQLLQVLPGASKDDLGRALRRLELRGRIKASGVGIWRSA